MKKLLFIIAMMLPMFVFIECTGKKNVNAIKTKKPTEQLTIFLNQCLLEHPNALNNEVTRTILADTIRERLFQNDTLPILSNLPMRYEGCMQYPERVFETFETEYDKNAGKYVVKFSFGEYSSKIKLSSKFESTFQVFTILDKETVGKLVDGDLYNINGKFRDFANNTQKTGFVLPNRKCIVDYPRVISINNTPYINLGTLVIDDLSFSKFNNQE